MSGENLFGMPKDDQIARKFGAAWNSYLEGIQKLAERQLTFVTTSNVDAAIGGLTIGASYSQSEVQALRDACETLADDLRAIKAEMIAREAMKAS